MIIFGDHTFIASNFDSEEELENVVINNSELIFGPSSVLLPKALIRSAEGVGTIPDGFAIDLAEKRWFIVEAELSTHSVWSHIAPKIAKQIIAASQPLTRQLLVDKVIEQVKNDESTHDKFNELGVHVIDIRQYLSEILKAPPIIGLPIDKIGIDLQEWAATLKNEVRLWRVRKLVDFKNPENMLYEIPDEYTPVFASKVDDPNQKIGITTYDVTIYDLMEAGLLNEGEELIMQYKPRTGEQRRYTGHIRSDGSITVLDQSFTSPSYAALKGIQDAGSNRKTVNGWTSWKDKHGKMLSELRETYLNGKE